MYEVALDVLKKINDNNLEAYIVGGYARDKYLGIESFDIDITTQAKYDDLILIFGNNIVKKGFLSYSLSYKNYEFDITSFRKEISYSKNRFPKVIYTDSFIIDLERRDFVINTLCIDKNGKYIDLMGAKEDLDNKLIRCVLNSDRKISEDILRSLRAVRFATILNFKLDDELFNSIKKYGYLLSNLSNKRKEFELNKILNSKNKDYVINLLKKLDILKYLN